MHRRDVLKFTLAAGLTTVAVRWAVAETPIPQPGPDDQCPVCGMKPAKYPNWVAVVQYRDGKAYFFDGPGDMFRYLQDLPKYAPGRAVNDIAAIAVTEFYGLTRIDARKAYYVIGSDVAGPMGHELVPLASREAAEEFLRDHKGERMLTFEEVTPDLIGKLGGM